MKDFVATYKRADNTFSKIKCVIAKILYAQVVTLLGRIVLLPSEYDMMAKKYELN